MANLNKQVTKLKLGMKVTTEYHYDERDVVRKITEFRLDSSMGSGYGASADDGGPCSKCNLRASEVRYVDAAWFIPVE